MIIFFLLKIISTIIYGLEIFLMIRAVMTWVSPDFTTSFGQLVYTVTEFMISPVRKFLNRFEFTRTSPIDISFLVTFILLAVLKSIISSLYFL